MANTVACCAEQFIAQTCVPTFVEHLPRQESEEKELGIRSLLKWVTGTDDFNFGELILK
jgi:hypothetical protein